MIFIWQRFYEKPLILPIFFSIVVTQLIKTDHQKPHQLRETETMILFQIQTYLVIECYVGIEYYMIYIVHGDIDDCWPLKKMFYSVYGYTYV